VLEIPGTYFFQAVIFVLKVTEYKLEPLSLTLQCLQEGDTVSPEEVVLAAQAVTILGHRKNF
jgi:hypothetical protein